MYNAYSRSYRRTVLGHFFQGIRERVQHGVRQVSSDWEGRNHPERAALWLKKSAFPDATIQFLPVRNQQPLPTIVQHYLARYPLGRFYEQAVREFGRQAGLAAADVALWRWLSNPKSSEFILAQPDYVCLQVSILAVG